MNRQTTAGFTIIELMLTIAVAAVLLAVAVPSFTNMVLNNCLTTKTNGFVGAMQLARSTAITYRENVGVGSLTCHIDDGDTDTATGTCDDANDFGEGVVIFRDLDNDGLADTADVEDPNGNGVLDAGEDLNGNNILDSEIIKRVRFNCPAIMDETVGPNDATDNSTVFFYTQNGSANPRATINVCDSRPAGTYNGRRITLSATGRPTTDSTFTSCP